MEHAMNEKMRGKVNEGKLDEATGSRVVSPCAGTKEFQSVGRDSTPAPEERMIRTFRKPPRLLRSVRRPRAWHV